MDISNLKPILTKTQDKAHPAEALEKDAKYRAVHCERCTLHRSYGNNKHTKLLNSFDDALLDAICKCIKTRTSLQIILCNNCILYLGEKGGKLAEEQGKA